MAFFRAALQGLQPATRTVAKQGFGKVSVAMAKQAAHHLHTGSVPGADWSKAGVITHRLFNPLISGPSTLALPKVRTQETMQVKVPSIVGAKEGVSDQITKALDDLADASRYFSRLSPHVRAATITTFAQKTSEFRGIIDSATENVGKDLVQQEVDGKECENVTMMYAKEFTDQALNHQRTLSDYPSGFVVLSPPYNFAAITMMMMHQAFTENKSVLFLVNKQNKPLIKAALEIAKASGFEDMVEVCDTKGLSKEDIGRLVATFNAHPSCAEHRFTGHGDTIQGANRTLSEVHGQLYSRSRITGEGHSPHGNHVDLRSLASLPKEQAHNILWSLDVSKAGYKSQKCSAENVRWVSPEDYDIIREYYAEKQDEIRDLYNSPDLVLGISEAKRDQVRRLIEDGGEFQVGSLGDLDTEHPGPIVILADPSEETSTFLAREYDEMFGPILVIAKKPENPALVKKLDTDPTLTHGLFGSEDEVSEFFKQMMSGEIMPGGNCYVGVLEDTAKAGTTAAEEELGFSGPHGAPGSGVSRGGDTRPMGIGTITPNGLPFVIPDVAEVRLTNDQYAFLTQGLSTQEINEQFYRVDSKLGTQNVDLLPLRQEFGVQKNSKTPNPPELAYIA